jgi:hypothetical protein
MDIGRKTLSLKQNLEQDGGSWVKVSLLERVCENFYVGVSFI